MKFEDLTTEQLWQLRQEVVLNSLYASDFSNNFGFAPESMQEFFEGYLDWVDEILEENNIKPKTQEEWWLAFEEYDTPENLQEWFYCYDDFDWVEYED